MGKKVNRNVAWLFWQYHITLFAIYWGLWIATFAILMALANVCPETVLSFLKSADFLAKWITQLFWKAFAPQDIQDMVSQAGQLVAPFADKVRWAGRKAAQFVGPQAMIIVHLALNGFLMVSITAWLARLPLIPLVRRSLVAKLQGN